MKINLLLIAILLAFTSSAQQPLSVTEAQELGLQNNVKVKNAKLEVSLAKKKVLETIGIGLPKINGEVNWQQFLEIPTTVVPANMFVPTAPEGEYAELQFGTSIILRYPLRPHNFCLMVVTSLDLRPLLFTRAYHNNLCN